MFEDIPDPSSVPDSIPGTSPLEAPDAPAADDSGFDAGIPALGGGPVQINPAKPGQADKITAADAEDVDLGISDNPEVMPGEMAGGEGSDESNPWDFGEDSSQLIDATSYKNLDLNGLELIPEMLNDIANAIADVAKSGSAQVASGDMPGMGAGGGDGAPGMDSGGGGMPGMDSVGGGDALSGAGAPAGTAQAGSAVEAAAEGDNDKAMKKGASAGAIMGADAYSGGAVTAVDQATGGMASKAIEEEVSKTMDSKGASAGGMESSAAMALNQAKQGAGKVMSAMGRMSDMLAQANTSSQDAGANADYGQGATMDLGKEMTDDVSSTASKGMSMRPSSPGQ